MSCLDPNSDLSSDQTVEVLNPHCNSSLPGLWNPRALGKADFLLMFSLKQRCITAERGLGSCCQWFLGCYPSVDIKIQAWRGEKKKLSSLHFDLFLGPSFRWWWHQDQETQGRKMRNSIFFVFHTSELYSSSTADTRSQECREVSPQGVGLSWAAGTCASLHRKDQ